MSIEPKMATKSALDHNNDDEVLFTHAFVLHHLHSVC